MKVLVPYPSQGRRQVLIHTSTPCTSSCDRAITQLL